MITPEQSAQLKDYFPVKSHEFLQGATYLSEEAITNRLDEVDPSWEFHRLGEFAYRDNFVIATFRMTVCGVSRDGIGMWDLKMTKKDGNVIDATDPEKSVSTDALKRAARLFGIGRYILEMGKAVNDYQSLERWLIQRQGGNVVQMDGNAQQALRGNGPSERTITAKPQNGVKTTPAASGVAQSEGQNATDPLVGARNGNSQGSWQFDLNTLVFEVGKLSKSISSQERYNTVKKMHETEHAFDNVSSLQDAITLVTGRLAMHDLKEA